LEKPWGGDSNWPPPGALKTKRPPRGSPRALPLWCRWKAKVLGARSAPACLCFSAPNDAAPLALGGAELKNLRQRGQNPLAC